MLAAACSSGSSTKSAADKGASSTKTSAAVLPKGQLERTSDTIEQKTKTAMPEGTQHLKFKFGPIDVKPGQNFIEYSGGQVPKPPVDGYILRLAPNIERLDGSVPPVDVIHLHHGVWVNLSAKDATSALPERFFAAGEEKTASELPPGYGYRYKATDRWLINYMIHNLTPAADKIFITYQLDFLPATAPAAKDLRAARPVWMDVQNGSTYPVFDAIKGTGTDGTYTYPDQATDPYAGKTPLNEWKVDRPSVIIGAGGHLHPGGLHDDLFVQRPGASAAPGSPAAASVKGDTAHVFRSDAHYWEPAGAVSWDVAMTVTNPDYKVAVQPGDTLKINTTYDTKRASWYESMGIMVLWLADGTDGADPFATKVDGPGHLTHGHLPENDHHGGDAASGLPDPKDRKTAPVNGPINIAKYVYAAGDLSTGTPIPTVQQGQSLSFVNQDNSLPSSVWHSITACKAPCNKGTGIAYPLADAAIPFDSGQLGTSRGPPTANRLNWQTPADLPAGTYTYFCRIHPFMRGAFTVTAKG